jgi:predicted transcriptional regulator
MKVNKKKELAKLLFIRENLSQKEIAERVEVTEVTVSKWVNENDAEWKRLRQSVIITKEEQLRRIYEQLDELNQEIMRREKGQRYASTKEADTMVKLTSAANNLETDASIADIVEVSKRFLNWLRPVDLDKTKEISQFLDSFIKDQLRK